MSTNATAWNWDPTAPHPCNILRLSLEQLLGRFGEKGLPSLHPEPIVVVANSSTAKGRNAHFRRLTQRDAILNQFEPDFQVTLSSSNSFSERRRTISLEEYLHETLGQPETLPEQPSTESWYLFGETYSEEWQNLLQQYELPPCHSCQRDKVALSFGLGNRGSGVQWHSHGPGFSEAVHGRKHWILYPWEQRPTFDADQSSRHWMEYTYPTADPKPYECTLNPGDFLYFPNHWWHATINLDPYTAFVSTFTTEHKNDNLLLDEL